MSPYPDKVWRWFRDPKRNGQFDPDLKPNCGCATTPASHAVLQLQWLQSDDGRIEDALFLALGCPYLIATGAWLCGHLVGRKREAIESLEVAWIAEQLDLPAVKRYCAVMAVEALNQALTSTPELTPELNPEPSQHAVASGSSAASTESAT